MQSTLPVDSIVQWLYATHAGYPLVGILLLMMAVDVVIGLLAAIATSTISSTISHKGMIRKAIMLLLVAVGCILEPFSGGLPTSKLIAMAFIVTEFISIIENSARAGVPIPKPLYDILQKLTSNEKAAISPNQVSSSVNVGHANYVDVHETRVDVHEIQQPKV